MSCRAADTYLVSGISKQYQAANKNLFHFISPDKETKTSSSRRFNMPLETYSMVCRRKSSSSSRSLNMFIWGIATSSSTTSGVLFTARLSQVLDWLGISISFRTPSKPSAGNQTSVKLLIKMALELDFKAQVHNMILVHDQSTIFHNDRTLVQIYLKQSRPTFWPSWLDSTLGNFVMILVHCLRFRRLLNWREEFESPARLEKWCGTQLHNIIGRTRMSLLDAKDTFFHTTEWPFSRREQ